MCILRLERHHGEGVAGVLAGHQLVRTWLGFGFGFGFGFGCGVGLDLGLGMG